MSHDRGCFCGREKYEYDDCENPKCSNKGRPMAKTPTELDDEFDFGFSIVGEDELESSKVATQATDKLEKMYKMILPLLDNLQKNPEKEHIYWPDRVKKIDEFKKKLKGLIDL